MEFEITGKERLWETFRSLTAIDSPSLGERRLCDWLKDRLRELGVDCYEDGAGDIIGGNCGNLYGFLPGGAGDPILLSAHMDTVEPSSGKKAILREDGVITSAGDTVLGADDAAGIAVILEAIRRINESGAPRRPIELLFPVAEEVFGLGSETADYSRIKAKEAYVLDLSGPVGEAANAAPTLMAFTIDIHGKAAHAGFAPQDGIHAIAAAARAVARIPMGEIKPGLCCNIGTIAGGRARNIIPENCRVTGEIRSLSHNGALLLWEEVKAVFKEEAAAIGAVAAIKKDVALSAYETPLNSLTVRRFRKACAEEGVACAIHSTMGGSDNNNFELHGIEGLVIACSMNDVHSVREYCDLNELEKCARLVSRLITGVDQDEDSIAVPTD
ncbi:MAG: M20/M25/M40 family metallo-hydrolase [Clostridiales bacterium]|jgi:tripeptide aminopeptidase|nr:M20/M25/M40 family metallo-hydrolase [Clostridiales bacterium]